MTFPEMYLGRSRHSKDFPFTRGTFVIEQISTGGKSKIELCCYYVSLERKFTNIDITLLKGSYPQGQKDHFVE